MFIIIILILGVSHKAMSQSIPSSPHSISIITNQMPLLETQFKNKGLVLGNPVYIRIFKQEAELEVWIQKGEGFELFTTYPICTFGYGGLGPKLAEGDGKAPEGFYFVKVNQLNPNSRYHLSFNLGFPNAYDRAHYRTGSALMVHGDCVSVGCYAMTDKKIEEIYTIVDASLSNGQAFFRVHAFPFRMNEINMNKYKDSKWIGFWTNLKQGYDYFEKNNHNPPNVKVKNKAYIFE
ncbi:MAG: L,D-transpeptidase family protein [Marinicellaceae bacterium]